jgi:hypothetical protein
MTGRELIFSDEPSKRIARHLAFWAIYAFYFYPQGIWYPNTIDQLLDPQVYLEALINFLFFIPVCILATYAGIYILLPRFLQRKRYKRFLFCFLLLFVTCLALNYPISAWYLKYFPYPENETTVAVTLYLSYVNSLAAIILSGISIGLKITKNWSIQQKENLGIAQKKARTELQLHKARIHPQFLFRTLNSINMHIVSGLEDASEMVLRLSDLLSYSLYCGKGRLVLLMQEISALHDFTYLENRKQNKLFTISVHTVDDVSSLYIPPMTILPLVTDVITFYSGPQAHSPPRQLIILISGTGTNELEVQLTIRGPGKMKVYGDWAPVIDNCILRLEASNILNYQIGEVSAANESGILLSLAINNDWILNRQMKEGIYEPA